MRFQLFKCQITRADRKITGYVVASDEQRASEIVINREIELNQENQGFTLDRVDEIVPPNQRKGLDALLDSAPAGMASYCEPLGWIAHTIPAPKLRLFRVEEQDGEDYYVVAPNEDVAVAVYCECMGLDEGEMRVFRIHDGTAGILNEGLRGLPALLEFGPVGVVTWKDERGWSLI